MADSLHIFSQLAQKRDVVENSLWVCENKFGPLQERHRSPSEAIIDSQSVKSAAMVSQSVGFDAGKKITRTQAIYDGGYLGVRMRGS